MWFLGAAQRILCYGSHLFFLSPDDGCLYSGLELVGVSGEPLVRAYDDGDDTMVIMVVGGGEVSVPVPGLECYSGFFRIIVFGNPPLIGVIVFPLFTPLEVSCFVVACFDTGFLGCMVSVAGIGGSTPCEDGNCC